MEWEELVERLCGLRRFGIEPGLERICAALEQAGCPDEAYRTVHVGGTNGKGTVASLISAILQSHGLRVGLYTSPHLMGIRERFRIDGRPVRIEVVDPVVRELFDRHDLGASQETPALTFFECTTLTAAVIFERCGVDVGIFEVGLGGRLDAVNAMEPDVSAITTIGRDHTEYLGESIEEIAREKAGIVREGRPVVVGAQEERAATRTLAAEVKRKGALLHRPEPVEQSVPNRWVEQHRRTARCAARQILADQWSHEAAERGMARWRWPGRFEEIELESGDALFVDAAHNPAGLEALRDTLQKREESPNAVIWGAMADKEPGDIEAFFRRLAAPTWGALIAGERSRTTSQLHRHVPSNLWRGAASTASCFSDAREATEGTILVFGSVYLVGELYEALGRSVDAVTTYRRDDH